MKKLLLTLFLLLSAIGWANAEDSYYYDEFAPTTAKSTNTTDYFDPKFVTSYGEDSNHTSKATGITYTINGVMYAQQSNYYFLQFRKKSSSTNPGVLKFTVAEKINKIEITTQNYVTSGATLTLKVGDTEIGTIDVGTKSTTTSISIPEASQDNNLTYSLTCGTTVARVRAIKLYYHKKPDPVVFTYNGSEITTSEISAYVGEKIYISSNGATKLIINEEEVSLDDNGGYEYTVSVSDKISVTPYNDNVAGDSAKLEITAISDDQLQAPSISPESDSYRAGQEITIKAINDGASVAYKLNDDADYILTGESSYTFALTPSILDSEGYLTISAYSYADNKTNSSEADAIFGIKAPEAPVFETEDSKVTEGSIITISCEEGSQIVYYTSIDDTEITTESNTASVTISEDMKITAWTKDAYGIVSDTAEKEYATIKTKTFTLLSSLDNLTDNVDFIIVSQTASATMTPPTDITGSKIEQLKVTLSSDKQSVTFNDDSSALIFKALKSTTDGAYYLKTNVNGTDYYLSVSGKDTNVKLTTDATISNVTIASAGATIKDSGNNRMVRAYTSTDFRAYTSTSNGSAVFIYRTTDDCSAIADAELAVEQVALDNAQDLTEKEGYTEQYPAKYTTANQANLVYNIESDTDANATYDVTVTAGKEAIEVTNAKAGKNSVAVPLADTYVVKLNKVIFSENNGEQELSSEAEVTNSLSIEDEITATISGKVISGSNIVIDWTIGGIEATEGVPTYATYVTYYFVSQSDDEIGVATEDYTEYGLKGYTRFDGKTFVEANNWASIAAKEGHLPMHFAGMEVGNSVMGTITVVYPFFYNGNLDIESHKAETDVEYELTEADIPTGINSVKVDANGEAEYYNLQGVRVYSPANGLYIRKQGNTVSKVRL